MVYIPELVHDLLRYALPILFALERIRVHNLLKELAHLLLEPPVTVGIVRAVVARCEPKDLRIRNLAELSRNTAGNDALLVLDSTNDEPLILGLLEDFMAMKAIEGLCGILSG